MITAGKRRRVNPLLLKVITVSVILHVVAAFVFSFIVIAQIVIPDEAAFEEPPVVEEEKPPQNVKVSIKPPPAQMNKQMNSLRFKQVGNISVANVDVSLPAMRDSFTVSAGVGSFRSSSLLGSSRGSIGFGTSDVSVFGIKARSERVLFIIDAGAYMLTDKKGGLNSYRTIKEEITTMVDALSTGTLFNVILFDELTTRFFKPSLVPAGSDLSAELSAWFEPVNQTATKVGLPQRAQRPIKPLPGEAVGPLLMLERNVDRGNVNIYMMQLALEQGVDSVFLITGMHHGFGRVRRPMDPNERQAWDEHTASDRYRERLQKHRAEMPTVRSRVLSEVARINKQRKSAGLPDVVFHGPDPVMWAREVGVLFDNPHPGHAPAYFVEPKVVRSYARKLIDHLYLDRELTQPSFNVILFLAEDEGFSKDAEKDLRSFVRFMDGKHRIIRGAKQIKLTARGTGKVARE